MAWTSNPSHFRVFRFLFGRGTDVHLPSQNAKFSSISQQPTSVSKFIICLFRHADNYGLSIVVQFCNIFFVKINKKCTHSIMLTILLSGYTIKS